MLGALRNCENDTKADVSPVLLMLISDTQTSGVEILFGL